MIPILVWLLLAAATRNPAASNGIRSFGVWLQGQENTSAVRIETFTLDNGLKVITLPRFEPDSITYDTGMQVITQPFTDAPGVLYMMWYKAGSADDPAGKSGLAHFVEHATVRAVGTHAEQRDAARSAVHDNAESSAFTSYDYTVFTHAISTDRLPTVMQTEAKRMANLVLTHDVLVPERNEIHAEWHKQVIDIPQVSFDEEMRASLYGNHPYGMPVLGRLSELQRLNENDVNNFYQTWYAPNNAVLIIASNRTAAQLKPLVQQYLGTIPGRPIPIRRRPPVPYQGAEQRLVIKDARLCEVLWKRMYLAPSYHDGSLEQAYALQVLAEVLVGPSTGRLYHNIITKKGLAKDIGIDYLPDSLGLTTFTVYALPASGVATDIVERAIDSELETVAGGGELRANVLRAKQHMKSEIAIASGQIVEMVEKLGMALTTGRSLAAMEQWRQHIAAVTEEQIQKAAASVLRAKRSVTGILLPATADNTGCVDELQSVNR